jgi:hypothetical protein
MKHLAIILIVVLPGCVQPDAVNLSPELKAFVRGEIKTQLDLTLNTVVAGAVATAKLDFKNDMDTVIKKEVSQSVGSMKTGGWGISNVSLGDSTAVGLGICFVLALYFWRGKRKATKTVDALLEHNDARGMAETEKEMMREIFKDKGVQRLVKNRLSVIRKGK